MTPKRIRSSAVIFKLVAASCALDVSRHRIEAAAFGRRSFLMPDDADALAAKAAETADDRHVITELAVAGQRNEVGDKGGDVIEAMGPIRMAGDLGLLPRRQVRVEILERLRRLG